ncbi:MAG TPA: PAS domain-containing protein, partial [Flavobacteriales bacterium]|nr:PAS domain-containing protein [Flavobacteriales bacterium]
MPDRSAPSVPPEAPATEGPPMQLLADLAPVLLWTSGPDKGRTWCNKRWLEHVDRDLEQESGDGWTANVHPADVARYQAVYTAAFEERRAYTLDYRLKRHDGSYRWMHEAGVPLYDQER